MVTVQIITEDINVILHPQQDVQFPLTKTVSTLKDIAKRTGSFSKSLLFPGTKENNIAFGQLYDVNIENATFNRKALNKCIIESDGNIVFEGYLRLLRINKVSEETTVEKKVIYEAVAYSQTSTFFQAIEGRSLKELDLSAFDHLYSSSAVTESWDYNWQSGYTYPLPYLSDGDNQYLLNEFRPAPYAKILWDKIFANAGYTYTWDSFDSNEIQLDKLILPYAGEAIEFAPEEFEIYYASAQNLTGITYSTPSYAEQAGQQPAWYANAPSNATFFNAYQVLASANEVDQGSNYNATTSVYDCPIDAQPNLGYQVKITCDLKVELVNGTGGDAYIRTLSFEGDGSGKRGWKYNVVARLFANDNNAYYTNSASVVETASVFSVDDDIYSLSAGTTQIFDARVEFICNTNDNVIEGRPILSTIDLIPEKITEGGDLVFWSTTQVGAINAALITQNVTIDNVEVEYYPDLSQVGFGATMSLNKVLPDLSQRDFVDSIVKMYNLYIDVDEEDETNLIIKTRDDYYDGGTTIDWTDKFIQNRPQKLYWASRNSGRNKLFTYAEGKDDINTVYQNEVGQVYGQYTFQLGDKNLRDTDKIELKFQPLPVVKSYVGAFTLPLNGFEPKSNQGIVVVGEKRNSGSFDIVDGFTDQDYDLPFGALGLNEYLYAGHVDDAIQPTFELCYGHPAYLFYQDNLTITQNNLFNLHWRRTVSQLDNGKVLEAYFDLSARDFRDIKLNDTVFVDDTAYYIVEISDFNAAKRQPTKVTLITADDEKTLGNFTQIPEVISDDVNGSGPISVPGEEGNGGPQGESDGNNPIPAIPGTQSFPNGGGGPSPAPFRSNAIQQLAQARTFSQNIILSNGYNVVQGKFNYVAPGANNNIVQGINNYVASDVQYTQTIGNDNIIEGDYNDVLGNSNEVTGDYNNVQGDGLLVTGSNETVLSGELQITGGTNYDILVSSGGTVGFSDLVDLDIDNTSVAVGGDGAVDSFTNSFITNGTNIQNFGNTSDMVLLDVNGVDFDTTEHSNIINGDGVAITGSSRSSFQNTVGGDIFDSTYANVFGSVFGDIKDSDRASIGWSILADVTGSTEVFMAAAGSSGIFDSTRSVLFGATSSDLNGSDNSGIIGGVDNAVDNADFSVIIGGSENFLDGSNRGAIIAGDNNYIAGLNSVIIGGQSNSGISGFFQHSVIAGGQNNFGGSSAFSFLGGGDNNTINFNVFRSSIIGGRDNIIDASDDVFIASSLQSIISGVTRASAMIGGSGNTIDTSNFSSIIGGSEHLINNGNRNVIAGGRFSEIEDTELAFIGGGVFNNINASLYSGHIAGDNNIINNGSRNAIAGGRLNVIISGERAFIGGGQSNAVDGGFYNAVIGGDGGFVNADRSVVIGGLNLSATTNDTVAVPFLSINDFADFAPRAAAPTAVEGRVYYDSTLNKLRCYDGTTWQDLF